MSIKGHYSVTNLHTHTKKMFINPKLDLVNVGVDAKFVKFCKLILKILKGSKILTSIKRHNSGTIWRNMICQNPGLYPVNTDVHIKLVKLCQFILKILRGNDIQTSMANLSKMTGNNPKLEEVNVDVFTNFDRILSKHSQDTEQK